MDKAKLKAGKRNKHKQTIKNNNNTSHLNNISQLHCRAGIIQLKKGRLVHSNFTCTCQDHRIERYPQTEWTWVMDFQSAQLTSVNRAHTHTLNIPKLSIFVQMPLLIHPNPSKSIRPTTQTTIADPVKLLIIHSSAEFTNCAFACYFPWRKREGTGAREVARKANRWQPKYEKYVCFMLVDCWVYVVNNWAWIRVISQTDSNKRFIASATNEMKSCMTAVQPLAPETRLNSWEAQSSIASIA